MTTELHKMTVTGADDNHRATPDSLGRSSGNANAAPSAPASTNANSVVSNVLAASEGDMRTGSLFGHWCDNGEVRYDVTERLSNSWTFNGRMAIQGFYDDIQITQFNDKHIELVRYLTGPYQHQIQKFTSTTPQARYLNGVLHSVFVGRVRGTGCDSIAILLIREG